MISRRKFLFASLASGVGLTASSKQVGALDARKVLELAGTKAPSSSTYTRMFPDLPPQGANNPHFEEGLIALGGKMKDESNKVPSQLEKLMAAGYTYLGQFIDHDLTFDIVPLHAANRDAAHRQNYRTPFLDLDQLYGGGPTLSPFLYRNRKQDRGKELFLIGKTVNKAVSGATATPTPTPTASSQDAFGDDLPRNSEGIALVGDPRQDENLIIGQLHVVFLRIHNWVLQKLESDKLESCGPNGATCFEQARRLVTWHYQWIIVNDYLQKLLDKDVYDEIIKAGYKPKMASQKGDFRIPIEFSGAAFRFGHSMVRNEYEINSEKVANLKELLSLTGSGGKACPSLPEEWKVTWRFFFPLGGTFTARPSNPIDTRIVGGLYQLSKDTKGDPKALFVATMPGESSTCDLPTPRPEEDDLPVITLLRGARMRLPSGQKVAKALEVRNPLTDDEITKDSPHKDVLMKYRFHGDTPLWYYILKEAEVRGGGYKLGPTGSKIVGDVMMSALRRDPNSYLSVKSTAQAEASKPWKPTLPFCEDKPFSMSDLIRFSKDPDWKKQQPC